MANDTACVSAMPPTLPHLSLSTSFTHERESSVSTTSGIGTPSTDRHDSITSPRSSLCSSSTDSLAINAAPAKRHKRVRFEESVCWSYFDTTADMHEPPPQPVPAPAPMLLRYERRPSFWQRFKQRNFSSESDVGSSHGLQNLRKKNLSVDMLLGRRPSTPPVTAASPAAPVPRNSSLSVSIQQPLRDSTGKRYDGADTRAHWQATRATEKGDWGDLLGGSRQSKLIA